MERKLTTRETQVMKLMSKGLTNGAIGVRLGISRHTVSRHLAGLRREYRVHNRLQLAFAYKADHPNDK